MVDLMKGLSHLSKTKGTGGNIGKEPEDFIVEEISLEGNGAISTQKQTESHISNGKYSIFILKKRLWSTQDALRTIANSVGVAITRMSAAGNKDRNAITTQLVSCWGVDPEQIKRVRVKDIEILNCWKADMPIKIGDLIGNRFEIRIKNIKSIVPLHKIEKETDGFVPNYFGPQRFGMRGNNYIVGKLLVQGKIREATLEFVAGGKDEIEEARTARFRVCKEGINRETLDFFPKRLMYERMIIRYLIDRPDDYVGALKRLPRNLQLMFVQSYQSYLFNSILSKRVKNDELVQKEDEISCGINSYGFIDPSIKGSESILGRMIGYDTNPTKEEEDILWEEGIDATNFRLRGLSELSVTGALRPMLTNVKGLKVSKKENNSCVLHFELPKGSYATSVLREFIDTNKK